MAAPTIGTDSPQNHADRAGDTVRDVPRRAEGVELIGAYQGSGHVEGKYLVGRADGQMIQLPQLLYRLAELLDGRRDSAALAAALSADAERGITAEQVEFLVAERLRPAGIAAADVAATGQAPVVAAQSDPFLALRHRAPLCSARGTWRIAGLFTFLHRPAVLVLALAGFVALDVWLVVAGAAGQIVPAATALIYQPFLTLVVLATILVCCAFHECGHASACRYGGARPGSMGVGLYLIWPAVYTTVTDAYRLSRAGRLRTDLGGVYFNVLFISGLSVLYLATGEPWVLVAIVLLHVETVTQFLPTVRFDGYYILSDIIGLPDLFMYLVPVVRSAVPGRTPDPRVAQLRPWVRRVITFWVLAVIPCLLLMLAMFVAVAPHTLPVLFAVIGELIGAVGEAVRAGQTATATLGVLQLIFVVLPWIGSGLILWMLASQARGALAIRRRRLAAVPAPGPAHEPAADPATEPTPDRDAVTPVPPSAPASSSAPASTPRDDTGPRHAAQARPETAADRDARAGDPVGWFIASLVPVLLLTAAAVAGLGARITTAGESLVAAAAGAAAGVPVPVPDVTAVTAFGVRQMAACATLLAGLGVDGVTDGLRATLLAVAVAGAAAVWAMARRFGMSPPAAAAATVLAAVPAPALALHAALDPAVLAAVWLTVGAALFGQRPARTGVATVALLAAALTAPIAVLGIGAFGVHGMLARPAAAGAWARRGRLAAAGLVGAAGGLAALSTSVPDGPLSATGAYPVPPSVLVPVLVVALLGAAVAWHGRTPLAPLGTGVVVLSVWALVVPPSAGTVLLLVLPATAVLAAGTLDRFVPRIRRAQGQLAVVAVVALVVATSWPTVLAAFGPDPQRDALAAWVRTELGGATLRADPLTTVELVRAGVDPGRLVPLDAAGGVTGPTAVAGRPGTATPPGAVVFSAPQGPDGAPVTVRVPDPAGGSPSQVERADVGGQIAGNPGLVLEGTSADRLRSGDVDERVSTVLAGLAGTHRLTVAGFERAPGEPDTVPARTVLVTAVDGVPVTEPFASGLVVDWLQGQLPRYRPDRAQVDQGRAALVVHFPVEAPRSAS